MKSESYFLQFYQREPYDLGIDNCPLMKGQDFEAVAEKILLGYVNNQTIAPSQCPQFVRLVTEDDGQVTSVIFTLEALGANAVQRVQNA